MKENNFLSNDTLGFAQFWKMDQSFLLGNPFRFEKAVFSDQLPVSDCFQIAIFFDF